MASQGHEFLRRKFLHLFKSFEHSRKGHLAQADAEIHSKHLENVLRQQMESQGVSNDEIEKRIAEFDSNWVPSAMKYFGEMNKFAKGHEGDIAEEDFVAFNMSIRDHIVQNDALPSWFEESLRMSYVKCWSNNGGILLEDGLELLPGVTKESRTACHHNLTENNNKIDITTFLDHVKNFYSNEDPSHISKYIHGYEQH